MSETLRDRENPVFIGGFPRTGTTLIFRILHRHSAFHPLRRAVDPRIHGLFESQYGRLFFQRAVSLWSDPSEDGLRGWFAGNSAEYSAYLVESFRSFHLRALNARGARRVLDKTPDNLFLLEFIQAAFPGARFVCTNRDPADALASYRRRRALQPDAEQAWLDVGFDLDGFIGEWNRFSAAWREFAARNPQSAHVVSFDALTTDAEGTVRELLAFVGEQDEPHVLEGEAPTERTSAPDGYAAHVPVPNSEVWREHVGDDEAARVRAACVPFVP